MTDSLHRKWSSLVKANLADKTSLPMPILRYSLLLIFLFPLIGCGPNQSSEELSQSRTSAVPGKPAQSGKPRQETNPANPSKATEHDRRASSLRALKLLEGNRFDEAWDECQKVLLVSPNDARALYVSANVLRERKRLEQALQMIDRIPIDNPEFGAIAHRDSVLWCYSNAMLSAAEQRALRLLAEHPKDVETARTLAALLDIQGRRYEASLWVQRLVQLGQIDINTLVLAVDTVKPVNSDTIVSKLLENHPKASRLKSSFAFGLLYEKKPDEAEKVFHELLNESDPAPCSFAGLAQALIEQDRFEEIPQWFASAPTEKLEGIPLYWRILGSYFQSEGKFKPAVYCFTRSAELDPMDFLAIGPLAQCLAADHQAERAAEAERLFQRMQLTNRNINYCRDGFRRREWMYQIADTLRDVGRVTEAFAWEELCEKDNEGDADKIASLKQQRLNSARSDVFTNVKPNVKTTLDWSAQDLELPEIASLLAIRRREATPRTAKSLTAPGSNVQSTLKWEDAAEDLGVRFQYNNGDDPKVMGMKTYQSNGGGAGAIDFDRDGWPDLYVLQGGGDPRDPSSNHECAMFRNQSGAAFVDVAKQASVTNRAYGQGVAVGDWDQDGFPDMFVLNFGQNRLLKNMGDGTFTEVTVPDMRRDVLNTPVWSVSGAIADINGDHLPDLIEINYSSGIDVITHDCFSKNKFPQVCRPTEFPASKDHIYLSDGRGEFRIANSDWQLDLDDGRGLGVIVGNIDGELGNDVYIANDMSPNNLLMSKANPSKAGEYLLADEAVRRACAVDIQGNPQASMGVACADLDRNGELDLFMTNFIDEYNALYLQTPTHFFQDASRRYRLIDPKKETLGFGTQFLDLDLDGWQDALIVNGHVDDYRANGRPFEMRPQVFLQRDNALVEQPAEPLGAFFTKEYLSRALGIWDFNRDGRPDFYATHLDHPLSIVRNDSQSTGKWVMIELIGVVSERDAIGATVRVAAGSEQWMHQRLAGNGFECSNEPWVFLGLGNSQKIERLDVEWPSGERSSFTDLEVNHKYRIRESFEMIEIEPLP